ncbi:hypothetical protein [Gracilimonas halophila]|uniref:Y_Y_Y domain-containing protein n=1 Tax=Gracilimonas halophila TaxID=1834464 RepID=A0ABW5JH99_9BACT
MIGILLIVLFSTFSPTPQPISDDEKVIKDNILVEFPQKEPSFLSNLSISFNPESEFIYLLNNQSGELTQIEPNGSFSVINTLQFPLSDEYHYMETSRDGSTLFFWEIGLGEVYKYAIKTKSLQHISNTSVHKYMYNHGGVIDENNNIFVQGGYGFWEVKNFLLKYTSKNEWLLESYGDDLKVVPHMTQNSLWYDRDNRELLYMTKSNSQWIDEDSYSLGTYNLQKKKWVSEKWIIPTEHKINLGYYLLVRTSYTRNDSTNITHIDGKYFLNTNTSRFYQLENPTLTNITRFVFYYSDKSDQWIFVGSDRENSTTNLTIKRIPNSEFTLSEIPTYSRFGFILSKYLWWILTVLTFSVLLVFIYIRYIQKSTLETTESESPLYLNYEDDKIHVFQNGELIPITDDYVRRTWEVIYSMYIKGSTVISMSEFDDKLFLPDHSPSYRSKIKNKVFKHINSISGTLITLEPNPIDKRFKDVHINTDLIEQ